MSTGNENREETEFEETVESSRVEESSSTSPVTFEVATDRSSPLADEQKFENYCKSNDFKSNSCFSFKSFSLSVEDSTEHDSTSQTNVNTSVFTKLTKTFSQKLSSFTKYSDQSLVILITSKDATSRVKSEVLSKISDLESVIFIERSSATQIYAVNNLHKCPHFTLLTSDLPEFQSKLNSLVKDPVPILFVPSNVSITQEGCKVANSNGDSKSKEYELLSTVHNSFCDLFKNGIGEKFTKTDNDRGNVLKDADKASFSPEHKKKLHNPTISVGYSTQDCNLYAESRMSLAGNLRPFIRDGGLSANAKSSLFDLVVEVLKSTYGKDSFKMDELEKDHAHCRVSLQRDLAIELKGNTDVDLKDFTVEGMAILIVQRLAYHSDAQNSSLEALKGSIGISTNLPLEILEKKVSTSCSDSETIGSTKSSKYISDLHLNLKQRGYTDTFPCSLLLYSRKSLDAHVKKLLKIKELRQQDELTDLMFWALTDRMGDVVDYRTNFLESKDFHKIFESSVEKLDFDWELKQKGEVLNKPYMKSTAAYDKMGYWSIVFDFFLFLSTNFPDWNVSNTIDFVLYCGSICNGTSVPWRLYDTISMDLDNYTDKFLNYYENDLFKFLSGVDEEVAQEQLREKKAKDVKKSKKKILEPSLRRRGSCQTYRSQFNNHAQKIVVNDHLRRTITGWLNESFHDETKTQWQDPIWRLANPKKRYNLDDIKSGHEYFVKCLTTIKGISNFTAHVLTNLFSLCGLATLDNFNRASFPVKRSDEVGPALLLAAATRDGDSVTAEKWKDMTCTQVYEQIYRDFKSVFPTGQVTLNIIENTACELWRCYRNTQDHIVELNFYSPEEKDTIPILVIKDNELRRESSTFDLYFYMSYKSSPQNLFHIDISRKECTTNQPGLFMKNTSKTSKSLIFLTTWSDSKKDNSSRRELLSWKKNKNKKLIASSKIQVDDSIKNEYLPFHKRYATTSTPKKPRRILTTKKTGVLPFNKTTPSSAASKKSSASSQKQSKSRRKLLARMSSPGSKKPVENVTVDVTAFSTTNASLFSESSDEDDEFSTNTSSVRKTMESKTDGKNQDNDEDENDDEDDDSDYEFAGTPPEYDNADSTDTENEKKIINIE